MAQFSRADFGGMSPLTHPPGLHASPPSPPAFDFERIKRSELAWVGARFWDDDRAKTPQGN